MILALIALNGITVLGAFLVLHRQQKTSSETLQTLLSAHRLELAGLLDRQTKERQTHREEVQTLCQRLQAPEVAVVQHQIDTAQPPSAVMPMTDEQSARRLEAQRLVKAVEELEAAEEFATSG